MTVNVTGDKKPIGVCIYSLASFSLLLILDVGKTQPAVQRLQRKYLQQ